MSVNKNQKDFVGHGSHTQMNREIVTQKQMKHNQNGQRSRGGQTQGIRASEQKENAREAKIM